VYKPMKGDIVSFEYEDSFTNRKQGIYKGKVVASMALLFGHQYLIQLSGEEYETVWKREKELELIKRDLTLNP